MAPGRVAIVPTSVPGSQCSAKARSTPSRAPAASTSSAPPGVDLLGGLEDQPDPARQQAERVEVGEREAGPEHGGRVHVVPARVRDAVHRRAPRPAALVGQRQRVEVGAQRDDGAPEAAVPPTSQTTPGAGEQLGLQPRPLQPLGDPLGGAELVPPELGVRVEVAAERDELVGVGREDCGEVLRGHGAFRLDP